MLQNIRDRSSGIIAKFIVGLIAVTFVVTGVNFFVVGDGDPVVAEVGSVEIKESRFLTRLEQERRQLLQVLQDPALIDESRLRQSVLAAMVEEAAAVDYANELGLGAPEGLVDLVILDVPQFQRDGRFDPVLYDQTLGQLGLSRLGFRDDLKRDLLDYQVRGAVNASVIVSAAEAGYLARLQAQTRSGELAVITTDAIQSIPVSISDDAIRLAYEENSQRYQEPESVVLEYVTLSVEDFRGEISVSDADVRAAYESEVAVAAQDTERRARHILINESADALDRITDLKAQIDAGTAFDEIAKTHSDDIASRELGGDLGFAPTGTFVPEFEAALSTLPLNTVSDPVKTQFGYHLIEVLETRAREVDPFERRAIALREELEEREATQRLSEALEEFSNIAFSGTLEELRTVYGVEIRRTDRITSDSGEGLFGSPGVLRRAFDPSLRENNLNADVFEVEPGLWLTFRVADYQPPQQKPLEVVRDSIAAELTASGQFAEAVQLAEAIQAHWNQGQTGLPSGIDANLVTQSTFTDTPRDGSDDVDPNWLRVAFNAPAPSGVSSTQLEANPGQAVVVARVDQVQLNDAAPEVASELMSALADIRGQQEAREFWSHVNTKVQVRRP